MRGSAIVFLRDLVDSAYFRLTRRDKVPPYSLRGHGGPQEEFERLPAEYLIYLKLLCGMTMDDAVLDVGCGVGRIALQLFGPPHYFRGRYCGFDVDAKAVEWATRHISAAHPNAEFQYFDLRNTYYNPQGPLSAENFVFPYDDENFDIVVAVSVFTHLLPDTGANYLRQVKRVLKPRGKALLTFILLQGQDERLSDVAQARQPRPGGSTKWHHREGYAVLRPEIPETVTAYQETLLRTMVDREQLRLEEMYYGSWNGRDVALAFQDIVILSRPPSPSPCAKAPEDRASADRSGKLE